MITRTFSLVTYGFPHGAYQSQTHNKPELRVPSIRGHLRWWYDALFPSNMGGPRSRPSDAIFGNIGRKAQSGKIIVRIEILNEEIHKQIHFIPHKGNDGGEKNALAPGSRYKITITARKGGLSANEEAKLTRALDAWILLGSIGQRANRAAGSLMPENPPTSVVDFYSQADELLKGTKLKIAILDKVFENERDLRNVAGDFLDAEAYLSDSEWEQYSNLRKQRRFKEAEQLLAPVALLGAASPRKPSLLKLKGIEMEDSLQILALWDNRFNSFHKLTLHTVIDILAEHKSIGELLKPALPQLTS